MQLIGHHREFGKMFEEEMGKHYQAFRLELLIDAIHNETGQIKQTIRFLHQYEQFLLNLNGLYQADHLRIRTLRLITHLDPDDLIEMDRFTFCRQTSFSAATMLEYT